MVCTHCTYVHILAKIFLKMIVNCCFICWTCFFKINKTPTLNCCHGDSDLGEARPPARRVLERGSPWCGTTARSAPSPWSGGGRSPTTPRLMPTQAASFSGLESSVSSFIVGFLLFVCSQTRSVSKCGIDNGMRCDVSTVTCCVCACATEFSKRRCQTHYMSGRTNALQIPSYLPTLEV